MSATEGIGTGWVLRSLSTQTTLWFLFLEGVNLQAGLFFWVIKSGTPQMEYIQIVRLWHCPGTAPCSFLCHRKQVALAGLSSVLRSCEHHILQNGHMDSHTHLIAELKITPGTLFVHNSLLSCSKNQLPGQKPAQISVYNLHTQGTSEGMLLPMQSWRQFCILPWLLDPGRLPLAKRLWLCLLCRCHTLSASTGVPQRDPVWPRSPAVLSQCDSSVCDISHSRPEHTEWRRSAWETCVHPGGKMGIWESCCLGRYGKRAGNPKECYHGLL